MENDLREAILADAPGWRDIMVVPGKSIVTDMCFVICPNVLGDTWEPQVPKDVPTALKKDFSVGRSADG